MAASRKAWNHNGKSSTERGYGGEWRKAKDRVMRRDGGICQPCLPRVTAATEVDHIKPKSSGGTDDDDNLQAICAACHQRKTDAEIGRATRVATGSDGWPVG